MEEGYGSRGSGLAAEILDDEHGRSFAESAHCGGHGASTRVKKKKDLKEFNKMMKKGKGLGALLGGAGPGFVDSRLAQNKKQKRLRQIIGEKASISSWRSKEKRIYEEMEVKGELDSEQHEGYNHMQMLKRQSYKLKNTLCNDYIKHFGILPGQYDNLRAMKLSNEDEIFFNKHLGLVVCPQLELTLL